MGTNYYQVTDGRPDGGMVGSSATEKVGYWGAVPVVQPTSADQALVTTSVTSTITTTNIAATVVDIITLLNRLRADSVTVGFIKGS